MRARGSTGTAQARSKRQTTPQRTPARSKKGEGSAAKTTTDHDEIRRWVESRGGTPATVEGTERGEEAAGMLRIDFPGFSGEGTLTPIEWDEFFEKFDEANLVFLYDDDEGSRFNKFVSKETARQKGGMSKRRK